MADYMNNINEARGAIEAAMEAIQPLVGSSLAAAQVGAYLTTAMCALLVRQPAVPCRLDFIAE